MNAKTEKMIIEFHADLLGLGSRVLLTLIDVLAMASVEDFIKTNPLPEGADPDEMRSAMLIITVTSAVKRVMNLVREAEQQQRADPTPSPQDEELAKAATDAAIAKAQGKLN